MTFSLFQVLPRLFFILLVLSFYLVWGNQQFLALISAHVASVVVVAILCFWVVRLEWRLALGHQFNIHESVPLLKFGMPLVAGGLAYWCMSTIDRVLLRSLSGFEELAVYSVATSFAMVTAIFQSVFSVVWAPIVYKWVEQGVELDRLNVISETVLLVVLLFTCIAGFFSWVLLFVLPEEYARVRFLLPVCMLCPLFYALSEVSGIGLGISKRSGYAMLASLIGLLIAVICNFLLIPRLGAAGAGVASAVAFWFYLLLRTEFSYRVWQPTPRRKMYFSTFLLLLVSSYSAISVELSVFYFASMWLFFAGFFIVIFWSRINYLCKYWWQ
ncbi:polysaccharide biosynthesis protein [Pseudomonas sp. TCU-HL1]|nr:polysaccharide biosynthesis protein [Pseudomonas sp. TCU-HL1]